MSEIKVFAGIKHLSFKMGAHSFILWKIVEKTLLQTGVQPSSVTHTVLVMNVESSQLHHPTMSPLQYDIYLWYSATISDRTSINNLSGATVCYSFPLPDIGINNPTTPVETYVSFFYHWQTELCFIKSKP